MNAGAFLYNIAFYKNVFWHLMMTISHKASWGCGPDPLHDGTEHTVKAMLQDPDILRVYFMPFFDHGGGCDLYIETVEGVYSNKKLRFYWEEW